jgi:tRNA (cytidine/uridine-2'-O-)-methyltransferase
LEEQTPALSFGEFPDSFENVPDFNEMRLALYQTEIAQNLGTMLRLGACLGVSIDVIEPLGFPWNDARMRRAGMDYVDLANVTRHRSFNDFWQNIVAPRKEAAIEAVQNQTSRVILLDTRADLPYTEVQYAPTDIIMVGRESCGVPKEVFEICNMRVRIPMLQGARSLNVAISAAICVSEAIRQCSKS